MYPVAGPILTVPVTLVTSFFMLGIEENARVLCPLQDSFRGICRCLSRCLLSILNQFDLTRGEHKREMRELSGQTSANRFPKNKDEQRTQKAAVNQSNAIQCIPFESAASCERTLVPGWSNHSMCYLCGFVAALLALDLFLVSLHAAISFRHFSTSNSYVRGFNHIWNGGSMRLAREPLIAWGEHCKQNFLLRWQYCQTVSCLFSDTVAFSRLMFVLLTCWSPCLFFPVFTCW